MALVVERRLREDRRKAGLYDRTEINQSLRELRGLCSALLIALGRLVAALNRF